MGTTNLKTFTIRVKIRANNKSDCIERIQDQNENPIDSHDGFIIEQMEEEE